MRQKAVKAAKPVNPQVKRAVTAATRSAKAANPQASLAATAAAVAKGADPQTERECSFKGSNCSSDARPMKRMSVPTSAPKAREAANPQIKQ